MKRRPPRLALALLRLFVPEPVREEIEGDLLEEYEAHRRTPGWFWKESASIAWSYRVRMESVLDDGRAALRGFGRRPAFALLAGTLLALGIGVTGATFLWIDALWNKVLPYPEPERLVRLFQAREGSRENLSPPNYFDLASESGLFESIAAYWTPSVTLTGDGEPEKIMAATVSHQFFEVLGVSPVLGRGFTAEDDRPGAPPVAILGHGLFQRRFAGDSSLIGRDILLDGMAFNVVGVAPPHFSYPASATELWFPLRAPRDRPPQGGSPYRSFRILDVVGRLGDGMSLPEGRARAGLLADRLAREYPDSNLGIQLQVEELREVERGPLRAPLSLLGGSLFLLFVLICANVSGLWLARLVTRERDLAIRSAMGASRARLVRELAAEGMTIPVLGIAGGSLIGLVVRTMATRTAPGGLPVPETIDANPGMLLVLIGLLLPAALSLGATATLFARGISLTDALRQGSRVDGGRRSARARRLLVTLEMALAATLLVGSLLLVKSFRTLERVEKGFRDENVQAAIVELPRSRYREAHRRAAFFEELLERLRVLPGVERVSISLGLPLDPRAEFFVDRSPYSVSGRPEPEAGRKPVAAYHVVGPEFFETLGVRIESGRGFDARDGKDGPPVAIVNRSFARAAFPEEDPLGREIRHDLVLLPEDARARRVVGVVSDYRYYALEREPEPSIYVPYGQSPWPAMHLLVRASADPSSLQERIRETLRSLDPDLPLASLSSLEDVRGAALAAPRLRARLLSGFALAAAVLAALGLYGVVSHSVSVRTREIGLRVALGAREREVFGLVLGQALKLAVSGALIGVIAAALSMRALSTLLFGVEPFDPASYAAMAVLLILVAVGASYLPARRALAIDPARALR
jgi:putative ABC transport system permease protein